MSVAMTVLGALWVLLYLVAAAFVVSASVLSVLLCFCGRPAARTKTPGSDRSAPGKE